MNFIIKYLNERNVQFSEEPTTNNTSECCGKTIIFQWEKNSIQKLINDLQQEGGIKLEEQHREINYIIYSIDSSQDKVIINLVTKSHTRIPEYQLIFFHKGEHLSYLKYPRYELKNDKGPSNYNRKLGYYPNSFEEHLSSEYENQTSKFIKKIIDFFEEPQQVLQIENFNEEVNKLVIMYMIRNPNYVKAFNEMWNLSFKHTNNLNNEEIAKLMEHIKYNCIKGYHPHIIINKSNKGFVTFPTFYIDGICIELYKMDIPVKILTIHPKAAIVLIPKAYYEKLKRKFSGGKYILFNRDDDIIQLNRCIYNRAIELKEDVIGLESDLIELQKNEDI